jgi:DNA-directed RNA polymerase alpha subunit
MQYIATLTKAIHLGIEFKIENYCGYRMQDSIKFANGYFSIDVVFTPIQMQIIVFIFLKIK